MANYLKRCIYSVKEYGVVVTEWAFPNIRENSGMHRIYSHLGLKPFAHETKQNKTDTNQEMVNE